MIAGNTGNVVCNTSFTNLSDSLVKTEMAEADVAELKQLFDSVEAKQYLTGAARWSDGTEMVTLDYSHLRGRVGLRDGPGPDGLGHAGRTHRAGQRGLRPAAVQRRELHRRAWTPRAQHRCWSHAVVHRRQLAEHTANAGNFTTVGNVSTGTLTAPGAAALRT